MWKMSFFYCAEFLRYYKAEMLYSFTHMEELE